MAKKVKNIKTSSRLKQVMEDNNINAATLSKKSGVSEASLSQYINGSHVPSNLTAGKIASVLNCSPLYLMGFDVEEKETESDPLIAELNNQLKGLAPEHKRHIIDYTKLYCRMVKDMKKGDDD